MADSGAHMAASGAKLPTWLPQAPLLQRQVVVRV